MPSDVLEQARFVFDTVKLLQSRVLRCHASLHADSGNAGQLPDLTIPQMSALRTIRDLGQTTIRDLAEALHVSAPSASVMVDRLVEMGMVTRQQSQVDRREVVVRPSPGGEEALAIVERHILESIVELLDGVGPEYAEMWCTVYARIRDVIAKEATAGVKSGPNQKSEST